MLEITNITKSPIQVLIKSTKGAYLRESGNCLDTTRAFKSYNIPGLGSGKNQLTIEDEKVTEYIHRLVKQKLITIRHVTVKKEPL